MCRTRSLTRMLCCPLGVLVAVISLFLASRGCVLATEYNMINLGSLGGTSAMATGINISGQVVGVSTDAGGREHPFIWTISAGMQELATGSDFVPLAINDNGVIGGYSDDYAAVWSKTSGLSTFGTRGSAVCSINSDGYTTGWEGHNAVPYVDTACMWTPDASTNKLSLPSDSVSWGFGINEQGQVAGTAADGAFFWDGAGGLRYLGTLGGDGSFAYAINNGGVVVGVSAVDWHTNAVFAWTKDSGMSPVFTFDHSDSYRPVAINSSGMIVGNCSRGVFTWSASDGLSIIGSGGVLGLNDAGQIVGLIDTSTGSEAILWQPVPEPSGLLLLAGGFGCLAAALRRRRV
jgi:probable HAF family extracellular repeat protein